MSQVFGPWGAPSDGPSWAALALALLFAALALRASDVLTLPSRGVFLGASAGAAALLSFGYTRFYLDGAPRIIDATTYFLQAKLLAAGHFGFLPEGPLASFHGRFLVETPEGRLAGLFPPGYPLLLSIFVRAGAPMLLGPVLAGALVLATYALCKQVTEGSGPPGNGELTARLACLFSVASAALRYHTADTMSHGVAALYVTLFAWGLLRMRRTTRRLLPALVVGACTGGLFATRFASALPVGVVLGFTLLVALRSEGIVKTLPPLLAGVVAATPFIVLVLVSQHAVTGNALRSAQSAYYAVSDGPPGCFRYGFGRGIGCLHEHGDYVAKALPDGFGPFAAIAATGRRLKAHLCDAANVELFGLFFPIACGLAFRTRPARVLVALVALQVAAYVPFYFDGSYPGGGGRFYADVLPLEHVVLAVGVVALAARRAVVPSRFAFAALGISAAGFALHASHVHALLRGPVLGARFFDPALLDGVDHDAVVFVDSDHGFALGFDPARGPIVARRRDDALDALVLAHHPRGRAYRVVADSGRAPRIEPFTVESVDAARFEGESLWPPRSQSGGYAIPEWLSGSCASRGRVLVLHRSPLARSGEVILEVPLPAPGSYRVAIALVLASPGTALLAGAPPLHRLPAATPAGASGLPACREVDLGVHDFRGDSTSITLSTEGTSLAIDAIVLYPITLDRPGSRF